MEEMSASLTKQAIDLLGGVLRSEGRILRPTVGTGEQNSLGANGHASRHTALASKGDQLLKLGLYIRVTAIDLGGRVLFQIDALNSTQSLCLCVKIHRSN